MSIKDNIDMVKDELTSEEKFFEKSVMTERFLKKYKTPIIASVVAVVVLVGANMAYEMNKESTALSANETLKELKDNPSDADALARLKSTSPNLHDAFIYSKAIIDRDIQTLEKLQTSQTPLISDLAKYESLNEKTGLDSYAMSQEAMYKDLALVRSAIMLIQEGDVASAHEKLKSISDVSSLNQVAKALLHYGVK